MTTPPDSTEGKKNPIYIEWCDATHCNGGWKDLKEAVEWGNDDSWIVKQVGWIIAENKDYLVIASRKGNDGSDKYEPMYGQLQKIPKPWILKRKEFKL